MSEIEAVSSGVGTAFKGKKGVYLAVGVGAVVVVALVMRSRSGTSSGTSTAASDNTAANLAALGGSMQQSDAALQSHLDQSNAALASGISAIASQTTDQSTQIKALQDQLNTALLNEQSIVGSIGSLAAADTAQARQAADNQAGVTASIAALTQATSNLATSQTSQQSGILASISDLVRRINSGTSSSTPSNTNLTPTQAPAPTQVKTIFGASADLVAALSRWGGRSGYNFVDTTGMDQNVLAAQIRAAGQNGLIVGGVNAGGGVSAAASNGTGVVRVAGNDAAATAAAIHSINF